MTTARAQLARQVVADAGGPHVTLAPKDGVMRQHSGFSRILFLALALAALGGPRASAQALRGRVYDLTTGVGVANAEVALWRGEMYVATTRADSTGYFLVAARDTGTYQVISRKVGFYGGMVADLRLATRDTFELLVRMERIVQVLAALRIEGEKAGLDFTRGFDERRKKGIGYYLDAEQIAKRGFQRAPEMVYGVPGTQVVTDASTPGLPIQRILSTRASGLGACEMAVFVDGVQTDADDLTRNYTSNQVSAVEVYQASEVPARFAMGRSLCGVVLFWTRNAPNKER
ncbi:MAG: carboxypeptidase regulatory-like domain-containing protein [Gemmatimonadetes bacterium]|nr:carboxypeptidase regulatory-like domain-containing protein [Gemmatimonadota bacterium]